MHGSAAAPTPFSALHMDAVAALLRAASSSDAGVRGEAEAQLERVQGTDEFLRGLVGVMMENRFGSDTRIVACAMLKQVMPRVWVTGTTLREPLTVAFKSDLRNQLMQYIPQEKDGRVASHISVVLAKIAGIDWPSQWDDMFVSLFRILQHDDALRTHRSLLLLRDVLDELSSKRLMEDRRQFQLGAQDITRYIVQLWGSRLSQLVELWRSQTDAAALTTSIELSLLCSQSLHHLTVSGISRIAESEALREYFSMLHEFLAIAVPEGISRMPSETSSLFVQFVLQLLDTILDTATLHTIQFRVYLAPFLDLFYNHLMHTAFDNGVLVCEAYSVRASTFLSRVLDTRKGRGVAASGAVFSPLSGMRFDESAAQEFEQVRSAFFSQERVLALTQVLLEQYFALPLFDMKLWEEDPERCHVDSKIALREERLRSGASHLFSILLDKFPEAVSQLFLRAFGQVIQGGVYRLPDAPAPGSAEAGIVMVKDALYQVFAENTACLKEALDAAGFSFSSFLHEFLAAELQQTAQYPRSVFRVLRRRIPLLLGQWYAVQPISPEDAMMVYPIVSALLQDKDIMVQLAACSSIDYLVHSPAFDPALFGPYVQDTIGGLVQVILSSNDMETCKEPLDGLCELVRRMGSTIGGLSDYLVDALPSIWDACRSMNVLMQYVMGIVQHLAESVGVRSEKLHEVCIALLRHTTNPQSESYLYLVDAGLELWGHVLQNTPSLTLELRQLFGNWVLIMSDSVENVLPLLQILDSYIILGGSDFVSLHASMLSDALCRLLSAVQDIGVIRICHTLDILLMLVQTEAVTLLPSVFRRMLELLLLQPETLSAKVQGYFCVCFARLLYYDADEYFTIYGLANNDKEAVDALVVSCLANYSNLEYPFHRRTCAMMLFRWMYQEQPAQRLGEVLRIAVRIVDEYQDELLQFNDASQPEWSEAFRRQQVLAQEPLNQTAVRHALLQGLQRAEAEFGQEQFGRMIESSLDSTTRAKLYEVLG